MCHALKIGYRLCAVGQRLTDAASIDAYEHTYNVVQTTETQAELQSFHRCTTQNMVRRIRGYVIQSEGTTCQGTQQRGDGRGVGMCAADHEVHFCGGRGACVLNQ